MPPAMESGIALRNPHEVGGIAVAECGAFAVCMRDGTILAYAPDIVTARRMLRPLPSGSAVVRVADWVCVSIRAGASGWSFAYVERRGALVAERARGKAA